MKYIFSFWDDPNPPQIVLQCLRSWQKWNHNYKIVLLNKYTVHDWITIPKLKFISESKQKYADVIRILLIEKYGGFWVDSSILAYCSFDSIIGIDKSLANYDMVAYYMSAQTTNPKYPVIENWFFGAPPNSKFIKEWKAAFFKLDEFPDATTYYKRIESIGVDLQGITRSHLSYLSMHVAAQYVLQKSPTKFNLLFFDCYNGPFMYLRDADWNTEQAIKLLQECPCYKRSLVKLRGVERDYIIEHNITL